MTANEIKDALHEAGLDIKDESRLPNNTGVKIQLTNGAIVNCYDSGKYSIQGKNTDVIAKALSTNSNKDTVSQCSTASNKVFVVY